MIDKNKRLYFPAADEIIREILKKNGLAETMEEAIEKIKQKKECWLNIVYNASQSFAEKNTSEKDLILTLQKKLGTSASTAENIAKDIKEKLIPLSVTVTTGEKEPEDEELEYEKLEEPATNSTQPINDNAPKEKIIIPKNTKPDIRVKTENEELKNIIPKPTIPKSTQRRGKDTYREPIE